jgi:hypothetical protein
MSISKLSSKVSSGTSLDFSVDCFSYVYSCEGFSLDSSLGYSDDSVTDEEGSTLMTNL